MPDILHWLQGQDVSDTVTFQTVMKYVGSEKEGKSLALRLLVHYYGDVHQPLHSSDRYTAQHPDGDKGGNDFPLKNHYSANELHAVWDNVIYQYHTNPKRPFTAATWNDQGVMAKELVSEYTPSTSDYKTLDFPKFRDESFNIAVKVYDGLKEGSDQVLPDTYISKYGEIAKKRVILAAYRLFYVMDMLFGSKSNIE